VKELAMESNRIAQRAEADQVVNAGKKREEDAMHRTWTEEAAGRLPSRCMFGYCYLSGERQYFVLNLT